jgi:hypothetical protein
MQSFFSSIKSWFVEERVRGYGWEEEKVVVVSSNPKNFPVTTSKEE